MFGKEAQDTGDRIREELRNNPAFAKGRSAEALTRVFTGGVTPDGDGSGNGRPCPGSVLMRWPDIDFDRLRAAEERTVGWLRLKDTPIDHPIVQTPDGDNSRRREPGGESSVQGCILARCGEPFPDKRCLPVGHAVLDALQHYFFDDGFFEEHRTIDLRIGSADYVIRVWGAILFSNEYGFMTRLPRSRECFVRWKELVRTYSPLEPDFELEFEDDIMGLCTCRRLPDTGEEGLLLIVGRVEKV